MSSALDKIPRRMVRTDRVKGPITPPAVPSPESLMVRVNGGTVPLEEVDLRKVPRRSRRRSNASKSIYFNNEDDVDKLESLIARYPRASLSAIVNQLLVAFLAASHTQLVPGTEAQSRTVLLKEVKVHV